MEHKGGWIMQFIYKFFVSEKELLDSLPALVKHRDKESLKKFYRAMRKLLFWRKVKWILKDIFIAKG